MQYLHIWTPPAIALFGFIMFIFQASLLRIFIKVYRLVSSRELGIILTAFIVFSIASISLVLINLYAFYVYYTLGYGYMELYRKLGVLIYEMLLSLGFLILILSSTIRRLGYGVVSTLLAVEPILRSLEGMLYIINIVIIAEMIILFNIYISRGGREMLSGKLWVVSLLLIALSRLINVLPMQPLSDLFSIFMDLLAFISLYLMKMELDISLEGEKIEI